MLKPETVLKPISVRIIIYSYPIKRWEIACFAKKVSRRKWCWKQHLRGLLGYCLPATRPSCIAFLILFRLNDYLRELPNTEWSENPLSRSLTCLLSNELFCKGTSFPLSFRTRLYAPINYCLCEGQRTNRQKTRASWDSTAVNSTDKNIG